MTRHTPSATQPDSASAPADTDGAETTPATVSDRLGSVLARATKAFVLGSTGAALMSEAVFAGDSWARLPVLAAAAAIGGIVGGAIAEAVTVSALWTLVYLFPALFLLAHHGYYFEHDVVWLSALLGLIAWRSAGSGWAIPVRWRAPIVLWSLSIAIAWPVVWLRELDFDSTVLNSRLASSHLGGTPWLSALWISSVAGALGTGILWFDWLFIVFPRGDDRAFSRRVVRPLVVSWAVACLVGAYQLVFDVTFLNGPYAALRRASGTMQDGNAFGVIAALGGAVCVALAMRHPARFRLEYGIGALALSWLAVWASGSRTALGTALVAGMFIIAAAAYSLHATKTIGWRSALACAGAAVLLVAVIGVAAPRQVVGPIRRIQQTLPSASSDSIKAFLLEQWNRSGYGIAATAMIRDYPWFGVGIGGFHVIVRDYAPGPADNAQNWFRHQLAEFGLVGSIGWIWWVAAFGWFMWRSRAPIDRRGPARVVSGALLAVGAISMVGMPTQVPVVALTLWTLVFWYISLADTAAESEQRGVRPVVVAVLAFVLAAFTAGTVSMARHDLRPPVRAQRFGWGYSYGFSAPDPQQTRVAGKHAVAVVPAPKRWLALTFWINHFDIAARPVDVSILVDQAPIVNRRVSEVSPMTAYARVRPSANPLVPDYVMIETRVSRTVRPSDYGIPDTRDIGLFVRWEFVDAPPPGASTAGE